MNRREFISASGATFWGAALGATRLLAEQPRHVPGRLRLRDAGPKGAPGLRPANHASLHVSGSRVLVTLSPETVVNREGLLEVTLT